jgi:hypothetical protein
MKKRMLFGLLCISLLLVAASIVVPVTARAAAPSGAIFTTLSDGTEVNLNQFPTKEDVYLDGGPGPGAPQTAAGLDDGIYVGSPSSTASSTMSSRLADALTLPVLMSITAP